MIDLKKRSKPCNGTLFGLNRLNLIFQIKLKNCKSICRVSCFCSFICNKLLTDAQYPRFRMEYHSF